ncbi:MAG: Smr/MutS family protein [Pseudomonadota bacterium]
MRNKPPITPEDSDLFRQAIGDVRRINDGRSIRDNKKPRPEPRQQALDDSAVMDELLSDPSESELMETGEHLAFRKNGVQEAVLRKLRRGNFAVQAELDLHGMTVEMARGEVREFLKVALQREHRCVRIIHGKGRRQADSAPRLKGFLNHWLQRKKEIIAFCSARPEDGGTGAIYILLSSQRSR